MRLHAVLLLAARRAAAGQPSTCTEGPCGPGNDHCPQQELRPVHATVSCGTDRPQPQGGGKPALWGFHLNDGPGGCGNSDPNAPFYDP
eukprot:gene27609-14368_t